MTVEIHPNAIQSLLDGDHGAPFDILGAHEVGAKKISLRIFRPDAKKVFVMMPHGKQTRRNEMTRLHDAGLFEFTISGQRDKVDYQFIAQLEDGREIEFYSPYLFPPLLTDYDLYLLGEGRHWNSYDCLGAQLREVDGITGVNFAIWAPNAYKVCVIGDFNGWDTRFHPMRTHGQSGVWELFIPGLDEGDKYKFEIRSREDNYRAEKTDPYGFFAEMRPRTASIVTNLDTYEWQDAVWMEARKKRDPLNSPMSIYEVHLGSWQRKENGYWLTYRDLADKLVAYVKDLGFTHIEVMPVAEHPLDASWGYQVTGYFAPTSRFGTPQDFMYLVDQCHQNEIGVILDWVPAHFPKDGHGLSYFDGTHLYEHADPRQGEHPDWGTYIFNYARNEVRNFLIANALFWAKKYHIDGLRVDAVSSMLYLDFGRKDGEWVANDYGGNENLAAIQFVQEANAIIHAECPGVVTIAEESTAWPMVSRPTYLGGLGFTMKWNMGWMHDTLSYIQTDPVYRRYHHHTMTFSLMYAFSENFVLSLSHDEVVHGKGSMMNKIAGDWWQKFATLRLLHGYQVTHPGKHLIFMGQEFGQWREWSEARNLDWHLLDFPTHAGLQKFVQDVNHFYLQQPSLWELDFDPRGFRWIEANDVEQSVFSYLRFSNDTQDFLVIVCNFTPIPRHNYRVGIPEPGFYIEMLNSDSSLYGGGNVGNDGGKQSEPIAWHQWQHSLNLTLPPLSIVIFKRRSPSD